MKTTKLILILAAIFSTANTTFAQKKAEVLILPTIHGGHAKNPNYTFKHVINIIKNFNPDIIAVEIRPEDMKQDTIYLKKFYQPEMIMALTGFPGVSTVGIDFMGSDMEGKHLPDNFSTDTLGEMGRFRTANQKLMKDTAMVKARVTKGLVALKSKQSAMMGKLSANELLDGRYDKVTAEYTGAQTELLKHTPYQYFDDFNIMRDQRIADNIKELALKNPGKRIIVLSGANHHNRAVNTLMTLTSVNLVNKVQDQ